MVVAVLRAGLQRDQAARPVQIPPARSGCRCGCCWTAIPIPYSATVTTVEGRVLARLDGLASSSAGGGRVVELMMPAAVLAEGDYLIALSGQGRGPSEPLATYYLKTTVQR